MRLMVCANLARCRQIGTALHPSLLEGNSCPLGNHLLGRTLIGSMRSLSFHIQSFFCVTYQYRYLCTWYSLTLNLGFMYGMVRLDIASCKWSVCNLSVYLCVWQKAGYRWYGGNLFRLLFPTPFANEEKRKCCNHFEWITSNIIASLSDNRKRLVDWM